MINNLAELRKQKGFTQAALARQLGVTPGFISLLETGRSRIPDEMKEKINKLLGAEIKTYDSEKEYKEDYPDEGMGGAAGSIKEVRKNLGLSQREFAAKVGCSNGYVSNVETGTLSPSTDFLKKVAKACDVDYYRLVYGEELAEEVRQRVDRQMRVIDKYLKENDLAREQVLRIIKDGRFEK